MSLIKGIKVGSTEITGTYVTQATFSDTEPLEVTELDLGTLGQISAIDDTSYSGIAQEPLPTVTAIVGGQVVELVRNRDYTISYSNNTNAGQATVTATGINNYTGTVSTTWTINPVEMTVNASDQTYVYNGLQQGAGISVSTAGDTPTVRYGWSEGSYTLSDYPRITNVSQSGTVYYYVTAPNHNPYSGSYSLTIMPMTATLVWGDLSWVYDGQTHHTTCTVGNLISGDTCTVTMHGNEITSIGSQTVIVRASDGLSNPNYALSADVSVTITVYPGLFIKLLGSWTPVKKVFKKISGSWVLQEFEDAFSISAKYVKMN